MQFVYKWFWEGRQKWLVFMSLVAVILWFTLYYLVYQWVPSNCPSRGDDCYEFWLSTFGRPFYDGYLLRAAIIAPLLILPFSRLVFRVWLVLTLLYIPLAVSTVMSTPVYSLFTKTGMSNVTGALLLYGTIAVIITVSLSEYLYKKLRKRSAS